MNETEKLQMLIPHWLEHNEEHAEEYRLWAKQAGDAAKDILVAADLMAQVNAAFEKLGGALDHHHQHHE
jgi:hypothetical protein